MAFEGGHRETQRGGGFGSGSASVEMTDGGGAATVLYDLEGELVKFRGCIDSMGTQFDNGNNRKEMKRLRSVIKSKVSEAQSQLKSGKKAKDPQSKILFNRQSNQLETQIGTFQNLLDREKTAVKQSPAPTGQSDAGNGTYHGEGNMNGQNVQAQSQVQRMGQLEEREEQAQELQELERDILDLHDIHTQVATLVTEQGDDVDRIDKNVSHAAVRTEAGAKQIKTAVVLTNKNRRLKLVIVGVVSAVVLIVVLILAILLAVFIPKNNN